MKAIEKIMLFTLTRGLSLARSLHWSNFELYCLLQLGCFHLRLYGHGRAGSFFDAALRVAPKVGSINVAAYDLTHAADVCLRHRAPGQARQLLTKAAALANVGRDTYLREQIGPMMRRAMLDEMAQGELSNDWLDYQLDRAKALRDHETELAALEIMAERLMYRQPADAVLAFEELCERARQYQRADYEEMALHTLGSAYMEVGEVEKSQQCLQEVARRATARLAAKRR